LQDGVKRVCNRANYSLITRSSDSHTTLPYLHIPSDRDQSPRNALYLAALALSCLSAVFKCTSVRCYLNLNTANIGQYLAFTVTTHHSRVIDESHSQL